MTGHRLRLRLGVILSFGLIAGQACVGDDSSVPDASSDSGSSDATTKDAPNGNDGSGGDSGPSCTTACTADASIFHDCDSGSGVDTTCNFGCLASPSPHCGVFDPPGPVGPDDFNAAGLGDFTPIPPEAGPSTSIVFHTDTGKIEDENLTQLRAPNADPSTNEVANGIGFHVASYDAGSDVLAVFEFKSFHLLGGELHFTGPNPVAIVAQNDVEIRGLVNMIDNEFFGQCYATAGGGAGGANGADAGTLGGGGAGSSGSGVCGGGGGGANAGNGGGGGNGFVIGTGGAPGQSFAEGFDPLRGGGGGGSGCSGLYGGPGGAGGGAIAIFAGGTVTIAPGGGSSWGVNAGGCGSPPSSGSSDNGGAGAGGTILVEAHAIVGNGGAGLAANGGGGGGNNLGARGSLSNNVAQGTTGATCYGTGGNGAAGTTAPTSGGSPASCGATYLGGGGGGGIGRIGVGSYAAPAFAVDAGFVLSPAPQTMTLPIQ